MANATSDVDRRLFFLAVAIAVFIVSCATVAHAQSGRSGNKNTATQASAKQDIDAVRLKLVATATSLLGKKPNATVVVNGRKFVLDCIGTVSAIYWGAGIDITTDFGKYDGNGVSRLYSSLRDRDAIKTTTEPGIGDIIFWDNTWDRNGDGTFGNDPLTHAGIVMSVDDDGTIGYIHENYFSGIVIERMNLRRPTVSRNDSGTVINSPLYMGSYPGNPRNPPRFLAGDLWKAYGDFPATTRSLGGIE